MFETQIDASIQPLPPIKPHKLKRIIFYCLTPITVPILIVGILGHFLTASFFWLDAWSKGLK